MDGGQSPYAGATVALIFVRGGRTKNGTILGSEKPESARKVRQHDYLLRFYCLSN